MKKKYVEYCKNKEEIIVKEKYKDEIYCYLLKRISNKNLKLLRIGL